jgi:acyl-coenzyme A synthetase/AMP-(fatty) acid ligase
MQASDLPLYYNAVNILEHNLAERADKVALYSNDREMTFAEVAHEANQVGNALKHKFDVRMGEYVGILAFDCAEWVTSFFGTLKIGAIAIGMNTLLTPTEIEYILRDSRTRVLIVHQGLVAALQDVKLDFVEHVVVIGQANEGQISFAEMLAGESAELTAVPTHRDDFCSLNYSSGTTGQPKGILHAHKDYPLTAEHWGKNVLGLRESDRTFSGAKLFFTFGNGGNLIFPWYVGASTVLFADRKTIFEGSESLPSTIPLMMR